MSLRIWFQEDIGQAIVATLVVGIETAQANGMDNQEYIAGIFTFAKSMALNFGISWSAVVAEAKQALGNLDVVAQIGD